MRTGERALRVVQDLRMTEKGIQKADKEYRTKYLKCLFLYTGLGFAMILWVVPFLISFLETLKPERAIKTVVVVFIIMFLSLIPMAIYMMKLGRRILKSERFPPPGMKVIRDTVVLEGQHARYRGYLIMILSLILILLSTGFMITMPYLLNKFIEVRQNPSESYDSIQRISGAMSDHMNRGNQYDQRIQSRGN
jgi:hypothetical protein